MTGMPKTFSVLIEADYTARCVWKTWFSFFSTGCFRLTHASPARGMHVETYSREAFIAWNSPALHRSDKLLSDALDHYFEDNRIRSGTSSKHRRRDRRPF